MTAHQRHSTCEAGFTLIEVVLIVAIVVILMAVSASGVLSARAAANEATAIESLHRTSAAQKTYATVCGRGAYAAGYLMLGQELPGSEERFITMDLGGSARPLKKGYRFTLTPGAGSAAGPIDCNGNATVSNFYVTAIPLSVIAGNRSFAMNADGVVWQRQGGTAPREPFSPPAAPIR